MYSEITIENYRGLKRLHLGGLGRINLLVGTNNSGKTSLLEAIHALTPTGDLDVLAEASKRRGEVVRATRQPREGIEEVDLRHWFFGHKAEMDAEFSATGVTTDGNTHQIKVAIVEFEPNGPLEEWGICFGRLAQRGPQHERVIRLSSEGRLGLDYLGLKPPSQDERPCTQFVPTSSLDPDLVAQFLGDLLLTSDEDLVVDALRVVEPAVERVATVLSPGLNGVGNRGNVMVRLSGEPHRLPIGSLGDGLWRILGLSLALLKSKNGVLLVDEIDTGLHYSVMLDAWRVLARAAATANVQVFATTHSQDCFESLASAIEGGDIGDSVSIQRLERDREEAVAYSAEEIVEAAKRNLEVR